MAEVFDIMRTLHIVFAVLWAGAVIFWGTVLARDRSGSTAMRHHIWKQSLYGPFLGFTSLLTVAFGLATFFTADGGYDAYTSTYGTGATVLMIGMTAGIAATIIGWGGHMPLGMKMQKAVKAGASNEEIAVLEAKDHRLDRISLILVVIALLSMATFRLFA